MEVRRVISGVRPDGKSHFTRVEKVEPVPSFSGSGNANYQIWGWDGAPKSPNDGSISFKLIPPGRPEREGEGLPPPEGGGRVSVLEFAPGEGKRGMHRTKTDPYAIVMVIDGELTVELDEGEEILRPGDVYVINGARHAWRNRSGKPARAAAVMLGGSAAR